MKIAFKPKVWLAGLLLSCCAVYGQVSVLTAHNDIARTGQNLNETILTPQNVNPGQFGRLFSQPVNGPVYAQPLYVPQVAIAGKGTHNVVYIATSTGDLNGIKGRFAGDSIYAFDADTNGGANAAPLWQVSLLTNTAPAGTYISNYGVVGTPVIDPVSWTMYVVSSEQQGANYVYRLHGLDITTGAEKFGGPVTIQASVPGTGSGSASGTLSFDPTYEFQRAGLLLLNGMVYVGFGAVGDQGPWHGWIFSYGAASLRQVNVYCTSPNGTGAGIWLSGAGLAAEVNNPAKPYGRMFVATGNGSYTASTPYTSTMSYGMSLLDLDLTGGVMTVEDAFTPFNEALLDAQDGDFGSGAPVLLPQQTLASGKILNALVQIGKSGLFYILDRDDNTDGSNHPATEYSPAGLGGFNAGGDQVVQGVQTPIAGSNNWGLGVWGTDAYWNGNLYSGGTNLNGARNNLTAYSFVNGVLSAAPTSESAEQYYYPGPTPAVSANGATNGIVWAVLFDEKGTSTETVVAYDATNLGNTLYTTSANPSRDNPGTAVEYVVPTIANGKVYIGAQGQVNIYGLLSGTPTAPAPVVTPANGAFTGSVSVSMSDAIATAAIYYTTDGSMPTAGSPLYSGPFTVSSNETVTAVASATGYVQSPATAVVYQSTTTPANPVFSLAGGAYSGTQTLVITDPTPGALIYYTINGPAPSAAATLYGQPLTIGASETVQAIAVGPGGLTSAIVGTVYSIDTINLSQGFTLAQSSGQMQFNGSTDLDDFRLQLTNGGSFEAGSAFFSTPVNIQAFTTNFTFQLSNASADGITFTIQNTGPTALGGNGAGLGYAGIGKSLAIKFDLFNNAGEGPNSTGLYLNGATPTLPAISLAGTGIDLHSGDYMNVQITYDGASLNLTITDSITLLSFSESFAVNIPQIVGGNTAYVGFTGGTGGLSSSQKLTGWTYVGGAPAPFYPSGFSAPGLTLNHGASLSGTRLRLTDGGDYEGHSAFFSTPVNVQQFLTSFDFLLTNPDADGITFTIQGAGPTAIGASGDDLGYVGIPNSLAIEFRFYSGQGEGPDTTGLYINGNPPAAPAIDLSASGVDLHSGDILNAQLAYNGSALTVVITDSVTGATATQSYNLNIPAIVGGPTGYVGFTGGTGQYSAVADILDWVYGATPAAGPTFPGGFTAPSSQVSFNGTAKLKGTAIQLTDGGGQEEGSAFFSAPVNIQQFTTTFDFQLTSPSADGFTFTIQNASNGAAALGAPGGALGYGGMSPSVAVKFDLYNNSGEGSDSTGLYVNGAMPTLPAVDLSSTGVNLHSGHIFNVQLIYNGTILTVVITDTVTNAMATESYAVNIAAIVGGPTAYMGFTGGDGGLTAVQNILSWSYSGTLPASLTAPTYNSGFSPAGLSLNGGAALSGNRLRLTDGGQFEARSAFFNTPVSIAQFSSSFEFQLTNASADGFTFTIQGAGPTALAPASPPQGGDLGYRGIPTSVAVKFDLYSNAGEGPDSTGFYTAGASPTLPAIDLSSSGVNLHSGDIFNALLNYDGNNLTVAITDTVTGASATETYPVNLISVIGSPTAYVGFTAASGGLTAVQDILSWSYTTP